MLRTLLACSAGGDDGHSADAAASEPSALECEGSVPAFQDVAAFAVCTSCHSSENQGAAREGAPSSINFDRYADASRNADRAAGMVKAGLMPPSPLYLTNAEKQELYLWARCDSPQ
jgi:uncharacterized membrane protein